MTHPDRKVNPELIKACAELAIPAWKWRISIPAYYYEGNEVTTADSLTEYDDPVSFTPLHSDSDAMKLERALKEPLAGYYIGWYFCKKQNGLYAAYPPGGRCIEDKSDTLLLLKCVSAQTGIALWVKGETV
jgi:hypothetical protein